MRRSTIMKSAAIVAILFGIPLLVAPNALHALYRSQELNVPGVYNAMLYGAALIGIGVSNWVAATASAAEARPVVVGTTLLNVLGFLVALQRQVTDQAPAAAWLNVVIFLVLAVLYVRLLRREPQAAGVPLGA